MFRFESKQASVKFRLVTCRVASRLPVKVAPCDMGLRSLNSHRVVIRPVAAACRDGTALSPKWPPIKVPEEEVLAQRPVQELPVGSRQSLAPSWQARPKVVPPWEATDTGTTDQEARVPPESIQWALVHPRGKTAIFPQGTSLMRRVKLYENQLDASHSQALLTADSGGSTPVQEKPPERTGGVRLEDERATPQSLAPGVSPQSTSKGASFQGSITAPQDGDDEEGEAKEGNRVAKVPETDTEITQSPQENKRTAHQQRNVLDVPPTELAAMMLNMSRSEREDVLRKLTGHITRAVGLRLSQDRTSQNTVEIEQNAEKAKDLFDQLQALMNGAGPRSSTRNVQVDRTATSTKPCQKSQPVSPTPLPRINKSDLDPVMVQKGHSYSSVKLGRGEFGEVVLMQSRLDGTLMAVKRLTDVDDQPRADAEFTRETQAMSAVSSSRAFPKFLGTVDRYSFAMEFIGSLDKKASWSVYDMFKRSRSGLMKSLDWLKVAIDVTEGLMDMHKTGWTHNDLHNDNVLVCRDPGSQSPTWEGKIIDLGYASRIDNPPPPKQLTPKQKRKCYKDCAQLAPEIIEGTSRYNQQSDVYSLGILFLDIAGKSRRLSALKDLGKRCAAKTPHARPTLDEVLQELTMIYNHRKNKPRKSGKLLTFFRSVKDRIRA